MIKEIVKDEAALCVPARVATPEDAAVAQDLVDTMESLGDDCVCLAANQIGSNAAVIAFRETEERIAVMYNPRVKQAMKPYRVEEGCLSREADSAVTRYGVAKVAFDELVDGALVPRTRQYTDWVAEIIQHGIDHCRGRLV